MTLPRPDRRRLRALSASLTAALAALSLGVAAQQAGSGARSDLMSLYREAQSNDPTYGSARLAREAAGELPVQARAALRPNVSASVAGSENRYVSKTPSLALNYYSWGPTLTATLPIYHAQLGDAVDQAELSVQRAEAQLAQARQDLLLRVAQAYFDVLAAQDALEALETNKKATAENLAQAKREFEVGTKTIVDTHEAQARADQIEAQEQVALGDLVVKRNALRAITGHEPGPLVPLADGPQLAAPQPTDAEAWARRAEESNPGVSTAQANADIAHLETKRQRDARLPTVDLQAQGSVERYNGSVYLQPSNTARQATIGVQVTIPIYTGGMIQSQVREALLNEDKARQDLEFARRSASQGARQAYVGAVYGLAQIRALESAQVSAQSQLDSTKLGYKVGVRINLEVLDAETQLVNTRRDLKKARYDFLVNGLRLQSAVGSLAENDIEAVNRLLGR